MQTATDVLAALTIAHLTNLLPLARTRLFGNKLIVLLLSEEKTYLRWLDLELGEALPPAQPFAWRDRAAS